MIPFLNTNVMGFGKFTFVFAYFQGRKHCFEVCPTSSVYAGGWPAGFKDFLFHARLNSTLDV